MKTTYKQLLESGKKFIGTYIFSPMTFEIEVMKMAGYDFLIFDMEHERLTLTDIMPMLYVCDSCGMATVIRVPGVDEGAIKKALDMGASCVKIPGVSTPEEAQKIVSYCKYHSAEYPDGQRGACHFVRGNGYGTDSKNCWDRANRETAISVIIEGPEGIRNMEKIIATPGIDCYSIGQVDLAVALGVPGQAQHPKVIQAVLDCADLCEKYGKSMSAQVVKPEDALLYQGHKGISHFHTDLPATMFYRTCKDLCDSLKKYE